MAAQSSTPSAIQRTVLRLLPCCQGAGPLAGQLCQACPTSLIVIVVQDLTQGTVSSTAQHRSCHKHMQDCCSTLVEWMWDGKQCHAYMHSPLPSLSLWAVHVKLGCGSTHAGTEVERHTST